MTDFKWLRDIGEGRTPGPWRAKIRYDCLGSIEPHVVCSVVGGTAIDKADGQLIAAAGTLWDKMVEVIEAAGNRCPDNCSCDGYSGQCSACYEADNVLGLALIALQAARKEVE